MRDTSHPGYVGNYVPSCKPRAYVDMDGVLADYQKAKDASRLNYNEFNSKPGAFLELEVMEGSHDGIKTLENMGYEVWICTRPPPGNAHAYLEKVEWIIQHFYDLRHNIIMTPDKGCIGYEEDLLIDDNPHSNNGHNFRGALIRHRDWESTIQMIKDLHIYGQ